MNGFEFMGEHPILTVIIAFLIGDSAVTVAKVFAIALIRRRG
ncbi:hypothetical protein VSR34_01110 [Paraburkholderia sp. JHI2823]